MPLTVYTGRVGTGKTEHAEKSFIAAEKAVLVVPEQASHEAERRLTEALGCLSDEKKVLSFRRMARTVLARHARGRKTITAAGKQMLAAMVLKEQNEMLDVLFGAYQKAGVASVLLREISRMKRYLNTPSRVLAAAEKMDKPRLAAKLKDFGLLYQAYEERSRTAYLDKDEELALLAEYIESYPFVNDILFIFHGFTGFTPGELSVICALLSVGAKVQVYLCLDENEKQSPAFQTAQGTLAALSAIEKPQIIPLFGQAVRSAGLLHLEKNFFSDKMQAYTEAASISIFRSKSLQGECEQAARTITQLVRRGRRYRDILVLTRDAAYEDFMRDAFAAKQIPCFFDKKEAVVRHPVIVFLLSAIDIVGKGFAKNTMLSYMKSGFCGLEENEVSRLENYVLATGVQGTAWTDDAKWNIKKGFFLKKHADMEAETDAMDALRRRLIQPLVELKAAVVGKHTATELCHAFYTFTETCSLCEKLTRHADFLRQNGDSERADRTVGVFNAYIDVLDSLQEMFGEETMSFETFGYLLENGLAATEVGIIPTVLDAVRFSDVARFRGDSPVVLILGANEGVFPKRSTDGGFITERDFQALKSTGLAVPPDNRETAQEEMSLVYQAITAATEELYVSCCAEHEGMAYLPSFIIDRVKKLFPQAEDTNDYLPSEALPTDEDDAFAALVQHMRRAKDENIDLPPLWQQLYAWFTQKEAYQERLAAVESALVGIPHQMSMSPETAERMLGSDSMVSVSRLECYTRCPYSYFLQYILKVEPRQELTATVADIGSYMHSIVELFTQQVAEHPTLTWKDADEAYIDKAVEDIAAVVEQSINPHALRSQKTLYLLRRLRGAAKKAIQLIREHIIRGCYEPLGAEISFDEDTEYIPLTIPMPDGTTLKLRGKIDRADVYEGEQGTYFRIVDYKTGNRDLSISDVYQGLSLQLMVYMTALSEQPGKKMTGAGMLYFKLDDPLLDMDFSLTDAEVFQKLLTETKMKGLLLKEHTAYHGMDKALSIADDIATGKSDFLVLSETRLLNGAEMDYLKEHTKSWVAALYRELKKGQVSIAPKGRVGDDPCAFCPGKGICGFVESCGHRMEEIPMVRREEIFKDMQKGGET